MTSQVLHISLTQKLKYEDFENSPVADVTKGKLKENILSEIIDLVESSRARNLASRQDWLITDFTQAANDNHVEVNLQYSRYITRKLDDGKLKYTFLQWVFLNLLTVTILKILLKK